MELAGSEYSLCERCKYENVEYFNDKCQFCIKVVNAGYSTVLCGIAIDSGIRYLHQNFEDKDDKARCIKRSFYYRIGGKCFERKIEFCSRI